MIDGLKLEPGERVILRSARGGAAGYGGLMWLLIIFGSMQLCGAFMLIPILASDSSGGPKAEASMFVMPIVTMLIGGAILARWIMLRTRPAYFITDRRLIARRLFWKPVVLDLDNIASAARVLVQYTRYGRVVSETLTHRIGMAFHSGGSRRIGPVKDADEFATLLQGVSQKIIDCKALPDADGGLSAAEVRSDIFFAKTTTAVGAPRGPLFVGPTKIIGFAEPFFLMRMNQVLTIAGAQRAPEELEASMLALANNSEFGRGRAVIMDREGITLTVVENQLRLSSGEKLIAFDLTPADKERASKFMKGQQTHGYR